MTTPAPLPAVLPPPRSKRLPGRPVAARVLRLPSADRCVETIDLVAVYRRMLVTAEGNEARTLELLIVSASAMREVRS